MKKIFLIVFVLCVILNSSCTNTGQDTESEYRTPSQQVSDDLETIITAINKNDIDTIKELLSESLCDDIDEDLEINGMLEFIDGKIVSYDEPFGSGTGSFEKKEAAAKIRSFKTDAGTDYYIAIKEWYRYDEAPEQEGVFTITVKNNSILSSDSESKEAEYRIYAEK